MELNVASIQTSSHQYQSRVTRQIPTSCVSASSLCTACRSSGHVTGNCIPHHKRNKVGQVKATDPFSRPSYGNSQKSQESLQTTVNTSSPEATLYYRGTNPLLASAPKSFYSNTSFHDSTNVHDFSDLDFPSLAGGSLNDSLLNSPLEAGSVNSNFSDTRTFYPQDVLQILPEAFMSHNPDAYGIMPTQCGTITAVMTGKDIYAPFIPSVEMSHFDEATWKDGYNYLFALNETYNLQNLAEVFWVASENIYREEK